MIEGNFFENLQNHWVILAFDNTFEHAFFIKCFSLEPQKYLINSALVMITLKKIDLKEIYS